MPASATLLALPFGIPGFFRGVAQTSPFLM
jgi:hypothetical protein